MSHLADTANCAAFYTIRVAANYAEIVVIAEVNTCNLGIHMKLGVGSNSAEYCGDS